MVRWTAGTRPHRYPSSHPTRAAAFVGRPAGVLFEPGRQVHNSGLLAAVLVRAVQGDLGPVPFADVYYDMYKLSEPPAPDDDAETLLAKAREYYTARLFYEAGLALRQRDRFVMFLAKALAGQFQVCGDGWDRLYGLKTAHEPSTPDERMDHYRQTAINLALGDGHFDDRPGPQHFEITAAGGFMMCYRQPEIETFWKSGVECETFANEQELLEKTRYYLAHPEQRADIALAGQRRTLSEHLFSHRLRVVLEQVDNIRATTPEPQCPPQQRQRPATPDSRPAIAVPNAAPSLLILQNPGPVHPLLPGGDGAGCPPDGHSYGGLRVDPNLGRAAARTCRRRG